MSSPANTMRPSVEGTRPARAFPRVLFPAPLEPSSAIAWPAGTDSETEKSALAGP